MLLSRRSAHSRPQSTPTRVQLAARVVSTSDGLGPPCAADAPRRWPAQHCWQTDATRRHTNRASPLLSTPPVAPSSFVSSHRGFEWTGSARHRDGRHAAPWSRPSYNRANRDRRATNFVVFAAPFHAARCASLCLPSESNPALTLARSLAALFPPALLFSLRLPPSSRSAPLCSTPLLWPTPAPRPAEESGSATSTSRPSRSRSSSPSRRSAAQCDMAKLQHAAST